MHATAAQEKNFPTWKKLVQKEKKEKNFLTWKKLVQKEKKGIRLREHKEKSFWSVVLTPF